MTVTQTTPPEDLSASAGAPAEEGNPHHRRIRSFVLRQGRMTVAQTRACEELLPRFGVPFQPALLDLDATFGRSAPKILEIGFGMGETTAHIAKIRPDDDFLGIEVHSPGVGSLLNRIEELGLTNLRVIQHDAVEVVTQMIPRGRLAGIHVYFPDPWPKKRHHKRRLLQPEFVRLLAERLAPGGYLHAATDWEDYALQMLEVFSAEPLLQNAVAGDPAAATGAREQLAAGETAGEVAGFAPRPDYRPLTKFENRGIKLGHGVWDLVFRRI